MKKALERLKKISETSSQITLYLTADIQTIIRSTSKLPGDFDKDLFEFYKYANGADGTFFGTLYFTSRDLANWHHWYEIHKDTVKDVPDP